MSCRWWGEDDNYAIELTPIENQFVYEFLAPSDAPERKADSYLRKWVITKKVRGPTWNEWDEWDELVTESGIVTEIGNSEFGGLWKLLET